MSFTYPLGLLILIGIPIVILIYILRNKYNEQTVSSTYIWKLSDKFLKRRNPLSGLTGIISLILQILTIAAIAFAVARPVFVLPNAAHDYCFVLDISSSMNMKNGKKTRFQKAQDEIVDVIKSSKDGSSYKLVCVGDEAVVVFEDVRKKDAAIDLVEDVKVGYVSSEYSVVLGAAQEAFDNNPSSKIYLVTDKSYETSKNVKIIGVGGKNQQNYAVFDVTYSHAKEKLSASANVVSYASATELDVKLYIDGKETAKKKVAVESGVHTPVSFTAPCAGFNSFEIKVDEKDAYALDNQIITYNVEAEKAYSTLIVSDTGFFLEAVIDSLLDSEVTVVTPKQYEEVTDQYGLYIFESYSPKTLPDGAVWLINADSSIADSGFSVKGRVNLGAATMIEKSKSTATSTRKLLESVDGNGIHITNYIKYSGMYLQFNTLFSYDSNPLIFAGANALGNRQVVFGFNFNESDFALSTDFVMLMRNLLSYSFPNVIEETNYIAGEEALINILANAENIKATAPSQKEIYINSDGATALLKLDEVGTYVISMTIAGEESRYKIYAGANPIESKPAVKEAEFVLVGEREDKKIDGEFDAMMVLFILLAVLFIADWGVYCYEKYQLR
ncbi:MAG: BatA and WFA domain-containing protein [Clostridia bacterium]|nr:BatA and WFA domain-containing protein [Clostridia bacterium]